MDSLSSTPGQPLVNKVAAGGQPLGDSADDLPVPTCEPISAFDASTVDSPRPSTRLLGRRWFCCCMEALYNKIAVNDVHGY